MQRMVDAHVVLNQVDECMDLPPGFRFHPTDEEIVTHYLSPKVLDDGFSARAVGEVDLNKCEPWDLPSKAKMGEKEWYFFCHRDRKYPTGMRTNRATESGYWKATGKDKEIYRGKGVLVGMKKTLVFYKGRAPKGEKSNWVMHEFRLEGMSSLGNIPKSAKDEWVVCRVFHKNTGLKKTPLQPGNMERTNSFAEGCIGTAALPPLVDLPGFNSEDSFDFRSVPSFSSLLGLESQPMLTSHQGLSTNPPQNSNNLYCHMLPQTSYYSSFPGAAVAGSYLHQDRAGAALQHCKAEQYSNHSMVCPSQDTGLSTDLNTEISSVVSAKHCDDLDEPCSAGPVMDYDSIWKY